jgi:molybdate transport system regulatory protein
VRKSTVVGQAELVPHFKVWADVNGKVALSDWRVDLLEEVDACGSLAEAARKLDIPYRTAWYKLHEMETALGIQVLVSHSGGASRGGMHLTEGARDAIRRYRCVTDGLEELVASRFAEAFTDFWSSDVERTHGSDVRRYGIMSQETRP